MGVGYGLLHERKEYANPVKVYIKREAVSCITTQNIGNKTYTKIMLNNGHTIYVTESIEYVIKEMM